MVRKKKRRIVFLGAPGAGKGTLARKVAARYGIPNIGTGEMFRRAAEEGTRLGVMAKERYWSKGKLVPDEITNALVAERLAKQDCKDGFILDGYPRTIAQARALEKMTELDYVFYFKVSEKTAIERLSGRRTCSVCGAVYHSKFMPPKKAGICDVCGGTLYQREDDKPAAIKERFEQYHRMTEPLIEFYRKKELLTEIDAERSPSKVFKEIADILD